MMKRTLEIRVLTNKSFLATAYDIIDAIDAFTEGAVEVVWINQIKEEEEEEEEEPR